MKKTLLVLILLIVLSGCSILKPNKTSNEERYLNMVEAINSHDEFLTASNFFNITTDINETSEGYRFYVTIDKARVAMYGIEMMAIEKDVDYTTIMAANVGVLDDSNYNIIPGQTNPDRGYYAGISISGTSLVEKPTLYLLVNWHDKSQDIRQEFIKIDVVQGGEY